MEEKGLSGVGDKVDLEEKVTSVEDKVVVEEKVSCVEDKQVVSKTIEQEKKVVEPVEKEKVVTRWMLFPIMGQRFV